MSAVAVASECAAPLDAVGVEWALLDVCLSSGRSVPQIIWCTPESERERAYVACWGRDWPSATIQLAALDGDTLWLRADRVEQITDQLITDLIRRTS